jgi:glucosamine kinase
MSRNSGSGRRRHERTRASIVQSDGLAGLAHAESGSIKRLRVGAEAAEANLRALLKDVYAQAGLSGVAAGSVGVASCSLPGTVEWITAVLQDFNVERIDVVGDEVIALDAAFQGGPGILQIAGTGSNTIGRAPDGSRECAGGYSSRLGDEGSGYWIGVNAVRRALHAYDREEPTQILEEGGRDLGHGDAGGPGADGRQHAGTGLCGAGAGDQRAG